MRALVYRTSGYQTSPDAPVLAAERVDTEIPGEYAWMVEINHIDDITSLMIETGHPVILSLPFYKKGEYDQDIDVEIYDDYRE